MEDAISRQLDRIAFLRSTGQEWAEAVYQLRDMVVGLEDEEFWDGIPDRERSAVLKLTARQQERERAKWSVEGWNGYPVRAFPMTGPNGQPVRDADGKIVPVYMPTSENLSCALRIVMRLLSRQGIAWRTRRVSKLSKWGQGGPEEPPQNGVEVLPSLLVADEDGVETGSAEVVEGLDES